MKKIVIAALLATVAMTNVAAAGENAAWCGAFLIAEAENMGRASGEGMRGAFGQEAVVLIDKMIERGDTNREMINSMLAEARNFVMTGDLNAVSDMSLSCYGVASEGEEAEDSDY